eukprot:1151911-Pelagomonas_calceolata.AAC.1
MGGKQVRGCWVEGLHSFACETHAAGMWILLLCYEALPWVTDLWMHTGWQARACVLGATLLVKRRSCCSDAQPRHGWQANAWMLGGKPVLIFLGKPRCWIGNAYAATSCCYTLDPHHVWQTHMRFERGKPALASFPGERKTVAC